MTDNPDLSIIIPSYNAATTIVDVVSKCLPSTSSLSVEVLIVDDCSTDDTLSLIAAKFGDDSRVRSLLMPVNGGPGPARNAGLAAASGEFTIFLDADDFIDLEVAVKIIQTMRKYDIDTAITAYREAKSYEAYNEDPSSGCLLESDQRIFDNILNGADIRIFRLKDYPRVLELINFPWNKISRTDHLKNNSIHFPNLRLNEDILPHWQILCASKLIMLCNESLVTHFVSPFGNNATNQATMQRLDVLTALEELSAFLRSAQVEEYVLWSFYSFSADVLLWAKQLVPPEAHKEFRRRVISLYSGHSHDEIIRGSYKGYNIVYPLHALIYG